MARTTEALAFLEHRLELHRQEGERVAALERAGFTSRSALDEVNEEIDEYQRLIVETKASLERNRERLRAAKGGVFLLEDGTDGNTAFQNLADVRLRLVQAVETMTQQRAEIEAAQEVADAAELAYSKARSMEITVPAGAMVWSLISAPGAPVQPGAPVASWVDCSVMMVDVPVSDVETALLHEGSEAHVVIEGERKVRTGHVIVLRGSAGTLGSNDLAALAKGRRPGVGQALVKLEATPEDVKACAIGHAAFVDFPEVDAIDVVLARLRL